MILPHRGKRCQCFLAEWKEWRGSREESKESQESRESEERMDATPSPHEVRERAGVRGYLQ